jgi:hypothetical protein
MMFTRTRMVALGLLVACSPAPSGQLHPNMLPKTVVAFERMAFFMEDNGNGRIRGFDGAVPPGALLQVWDDDTSTKVAEIAGDGDGRFDQPLATELNHSFTLVGVAGSTTSAGIQFRARVRRDALRQSIQPRLTGTGSTPNQILCAADAPVDQAARAVLVVSGDNAVDNVDFRDGTHPYPLVALSDEQGPQGPVPATPWAGTMRGNTAWVTRYAQGGITAINVSGGNVLGHGAQPPVQSLATPVTMDPPVDADGDGTAESNVTRVLPRTPTGIAVVGNHAVVAFANVLSTTASGQAQFGPGMVASYRLREDGTPTGDVVVVTTSWENPQHVVALPGGNRVMVSSTGQLQRSNGAWATQSDGGVEVFDVDTLNRVTSLNLGRYGPSRPLVLQDGTSVYIPSILQARLLRVDIPTLTVLKGPGGTGPALVLEDTTDLRTVFECVLHPTGLVFCGVFDSDSLTVVDARTDTVRPWPFSEDLRISELAGNIKLGVQSVTVRPGRNGVDFNGADILVLMSLASRVSAVDTRFVLGP